MHLDFSGEPMISAPRHTVWRRLLDPHTVAAAAPGVESVESIDDTHFKVVSGLGVGAIRLSFTLEIELSDLVEPESARMHARGKAPGSEVEVLTSILLHERDSETTQLEWEATATISGTIASFGARLLEGAMRKLTDEFWDTFAQQASAAVR
jgi:carbon monoxide dehydrogenase subunit G